MQRISFADTKSCCFLAYNAQKGDRYRFPDGSIWSVPITCATNLTGFRAIVLIRQGTPTRAVLAFAGTDSIRDVIADAAQVLGILPFQYGQAIMVTTRLLPRYPALQVCGHSLGGGLAAYASVRMRMLASTINPAPLVAAASISAVFKDHPQIVNYIAGGTEFVSSSIGRTPGTDVDVPCRGNWFMRHSLNNVDPSIPLPAKA